jgi:hypothetical protein
MTRGHRRKSLLKYGQRIQGIGLPGPGQELLHAYGQQYSSGLWAGGRWTLDPQ